MGRSTAKAREVTLHDPARVRKLIGRGEGAVAMPSYVVLYKFTDQGAKNITTTVERAKETIADNERRGFKIKGIYWTQGQYDLVAIVESPDEDSMLAGLFNIAEAGNARSETLRAFTAEEVANALKQL